ncbi:MAG: DUF2948 family protein [Alphaproteobacteria bacterium]|nr:DUF2948 family protein [Alphaproteobacteria bacterium]
MSSSLLKLRAKDAEDVQVVSAVLQDSIVPVCDIAYEKDAGTFMFVAQRFRREASGSTERICCALTITGVLAAHTNKIDLGDSEAMLDLLAIILEPMDCLTFVFAGGAQIRLDLGSWDAVLEDFGQPWPALCHPCHDSTGKGV